MIFHQNNSKSNRIVKIRRNCLIPVDGSILRISALKGPFSLCKVQIFGTNQLNFLYKKWAVQNIPSKYDEGGLAIDGDSTTCLFSSKLNTYWWIADMKAIFLVERFLILFNSVLQRKSSITNDIITLALSTKV